MFSCRELLDQRSALSKKSDHEPTELRPSSHVIECLNLTVYEYCGNFKGCSGGAACMSHSSALAKVQTHRALRALHLPTYPTEAYNRSVDRR
jgi:hypothetical protein